MDFQKSIKDFFSKMRTLFAEPEAFFAAVSKEALKPSLYYYSAFLVVTLLISYPILGKMVQPILEQMKITVTTQILIAVLVVSIAFSYLQVFVGIGVTHLLIKLFKGTKKFVDTAKVMLYGGTPDYILQLLLAIVSVFLFEQLQSMGIALSIVSVAALAYRFYLQSLGIAQQHGIDKWKAILAVFVIPYGIVFLVTLVLRQFVPVPTGP